MCEEVAFYLKPAEVEFHLEEYKQIRAEVGALLARVENLFKYSLIVSATVYAWLMSQAVGLTDLNEVCLKLPASLLWPGWLIPPAFVLLSSILAFATYIRIIQMGEYLRKVEKRLAPHLLGWEQFFAKKLPLVTGTTALVWLLLLAAVTYGTWQGFCVLERNPLSCESSAPKK